MSENYEFIHSQILKHADPDIHKKLLRTVPGAKTVGVAVPVLRDMAKSLRQDYPMTLEQACDLMDELCQSRVREEMLVGIFVLGGFGKKGAQIPWKRILLWVRALDNWETCDQLASNVVGAVVAAELNHKGRVHPAETFRICEPLVGDTEPTIRKALGWALKEASKYAPDQVFEFLQVHKSKMHSSALRDAVEKLNPEQKKQVLS